MREDGERLVQAGVTSRAELLRVTRDKRVGLVPRVPRLVRSPACAPRSEQAFGVSRFSSATTRFLVWGVV